MAKQDSVLIPESPIKPHLLTSDYPTFYDKFKSYQSDNVNLPQLTAHTKFYTNQVDLNLLPTHCLHPTIQSIIVIISRCLDVGFLLVATSFCLKNIQRVIVNLQHNNWRYCHRNNWMYSASWTLSWNHNNRIPKTAIECFWVDVIQCHKQAKDLIMSARKSWQCIYRFKASTKDEATPNTGMLYVKTRLTIKREILNKKSAIMAKEVQKWRKSCLQTVQQELCLIWLWNQ